MPEECEQYLNLSSAVQFYDKANLDSVMFCTEDQSRKFSYDNSTVCAQFTDAASGRVLNHYGRIRRIFKNNDKIVLDCSWYEVQDDQRPTCKLPVVKRQH